MYKALFNVIGIYWRDYGGFREWAFSPFLHASAIFTIAYHFGIISIDWRAISISTLPTILGFSLAAYTITFTLMGSALHRALSSAIDRKSGTPLIKTVNATFFHVVFSQALALMYTLVTSGDFFWRLLGGKTGLGSYESIFLGLIYYGGGAIGCFLTVYSIFLLFSVSIAMFRLGRLSAAAPAPLAANVNDRQLAQRAPDEPEVIHTRRFAVLKFLAKVLRVYK